MIIAVLNTKGGCGKTTIAVNLSRYVVKHRCEMCLLVDSDPQGSARDWHVSGNGDILNVIGLDRGTLEKDIKIFKGEFDFIIIDGAPQLSSLCLASIKSSDIVLIPVQPSPYDIWASKDVVELIKTRQEMTNGYPRAYFIISRQIPNTILSREVRDALAIYDLPVLENGTFNRTIYARTAAEGLTVFDTGHPNDAATEIKNIFEEILSKTAISQNVLTDNFSVDDYFDR